MIIPELHNQITAIASQFKLFECVPCAATIREFLVNQNISGKLIQLSTGSSSTSYDNIWDDSIGQIISSNGKHEAIAVEIDGQELIFDNVHPEGIPRLDWMKKPTVPN